MGEPCLPRLGLDSNDEHDTDQILPVHCHATATRRGHDQGSCARSSKGDAWIALQDVRYITHTLQSLLTHYNPLSHTMTSDYVSQALVAIRSTDPVEDVATLVLSLARKAADVVATPDELGGLALFQSDLLSATIDLSVLQPSTLDRTVYVFKTFAAQPGEEWFDFIPVYVRILADFPSFATARSRFNLDGEHTLS